VAKTKTGHAIRRSRRRPRQLKALDEFIDERDDALRSTFGTFQSTPSLIANHVASFL
jgi:hypothetical protein